METKRNQAPDAAAMSREALQAVGVMLERIGSRSPHRAGADGKYDDGPIDWWTSGFWPGLLWLAYDGTGEQRFREAAWSWDERLERRLIEPNGFHHDLGFQFLTTAVAKHKLTGDEEARRRALLAADLLAGRFNLKGSFLRAWNGDRAGWSIVDSAMNLSLLFWASAESGDPRYAHIAEAHADMMLRQFLREDGSAYHIVSFDPATGRRIEALGGQGDAPESAWSRGAAWALYGMANAFRWTGKRDYLEASRRTAAYFVGQLPDDRVPHWDFRADRSAGEPPRDSSAAAIAASGLLELAALDHGADGGRWRDEAEAMLRSLRGGYAAWRVDGHEALLLHGTGHKPAGQNVDVSLIYGDYFYVEALAKLGGSTLRLF